MTPFPDPKGFAEWEATLPASVKRDPIWRTPAYRFGLWLSDFVKADATALRANRNMRNDADQLLRAVGAISSNLSEGYSRSTGPATVIWWVRGAKVTDTMQMSFDATPEDLKRVTKVLCRVEAAAVSNTRETSKRGDRR